MRLVLFVNRKNGNSNTLLLLVDVFVLNEILFRVIDDKVALQYQVGGCKTLDDSLRYYGDSNPSRHATLTSGLLKDSKLHLLAKELVNETPRGNQLASIASNN